MAKLNHQQIVTLWQYTKAGNKAKLEALGLLQQWSKFEESYIPKTLHGTLEPSDNWLRVAQMKAGSKIFVVQRSVSKSGMRRIVDIFTIENGEPAWFNCFPELVLYGYNAKDGETERRWGGHWELNGCGMDMHFDLVYNISALVFGHEDRGAYRLSKVSI